MLAAAAFIVMCTALVPIRANHPNATVEAPAGTFVGYRDLVNVSGAAPENIDKFLGIPYAEPPVRYLRFRKTVPKAALAEPLMVHSHGAGCIQPDVFMTGDPQSEDCLFLNVFAPVRATNDAKLAVMVFIHGGAFTFGNSNSYDADLLASVGRVIVVTINYRMSILGFLNVNDPRVNANAGLWDQHTAIKWVHDNIEAFGGDVDRVTVFGESAGAASTVYQGFFPGNQGLIHRIIAQSGTSAVSWAFSENPDADAQDFADMVNCTTVSTKRMVQCLLTLDAGIFSPKIFEIAFTQFPFPFMPSVDNAFVPTSPYDLLDGSLGVGGDQRRVFASLDLLTGVNTAEGGLMAGPTTGVYGDINAFLPTEAEFNNLHAPLLANITYGENADSIVQELIRAEYIPWDGSASDTLKLRDEWVNMYTDALYTAPMYRTLNLHAQLSTKKTYMYRLTAAPTNHVFPAASWLDGVTVHGDDLLFIFGEAAALNKLGYGGTMQDWEKALSIGMVTLWTNFAKTGNVSEPQHLGLNWPPYSKQEPNYLEIVGNLADSEVKQRLNGRRIHLWNAALRLSARREGELKGCKASLTSGADARASCYGSLFSMLVLLLLSVCV